MLFESYGNDTKQHEWKWIKSFCMSFRKKKRILLINKGNTTSTYWQRCKGMMAKQILKGHSTLKRLFCTIVFIMLTKISLYCFRVEYKSNVMHTHSHKKLIKLGSSCSCHFFSLPFFHIYNTEIAAHYINSYYIS